MNKFIGFKRHIKVAPFKLKFSRMSKSNSSTRSNSVETPGECESELSSPQNNVPAILETAEGPESGVPSSPPPSYEHVLEEVKSIVCIVMVTNKSLRNLDFITL